ncbi:MAG: hypothetical protein AABW64_01970 [Nanoarchaeota archaeon]
MQDEAARKPATHFGKKARVQEMRMQGISQLEKGKDNSGTRCKIGNGNKF